MDLEFLYAAIWFKIRFYETAVTVYLSYKNANKKNFKDLGMTEHTHMTHTLTQNTETYTTPKAPWTCKYLDIPLLLVDIITTLADEHRIKKNRRWMGNGMFSEY